MMEETLLYYATYEQIWDGGTLISHTGWEAAPDFDMQSRLWHQNAVKNQNKVCYTEPFTDVNTGKIIVTLSYRVLDNDGNLIGVSAADIVLDALSEAVKDIHLSKNSSVNIVTTNGLFITNDDFSAIMQKNYFDNAGISQVAENFRSLSEMQKQVDSGIQDCASASKTLSESSQSITQISAQAQESVGILTEAVSKFKVD